MIHYTDALTRVIDDIVRRVPELSFIDTTRLLVFARFGRPEAAGAYATCHALNLPTSEPGYYYWKDRQSGRITRRTEFFVTRTPEVHVGLRRMDYLISVCVPRFCDQPIAGTPKEELYPGCESWVARLDTLVHELYHIAPGSPGLRAFERADGVPCPGTHGPSFGSEVAALVRRYLASGPDPKLLMFLQEDFSTLARHAGGVLGTTFRNFPSFPQRYVEPVSACLDDGLEGVAVVPVQRTRQPVRYTAEDLVVRTFTRRGVKRVQVGRDRDRAA